MNGNEPENNKQQADNRQDIEQDNPGTAASYDISQFMPLDNLVYAPLKAIAVSNMNLSASIIDNIKSMGTVKYVENEEVLFLKSLNMEYERLHPTEDDNAYVENVEMQVPFLSLVPVPNLNIKNAEVDFHTEILVTETKDLKENIVARICSPDTRKTDGLPKVEYKIKLKAVDDTEGYMRITDVLNSSPVNKHINARPVTNKKTVPETVQAHFDNKRYLKKQAGILQGLYKEISEFINENEKMEEASLTGNISFEKEKYETMKQNIIAKILKIKEAMLDDKLEELKEGGIGIE